MIIVASAAPRIVPATPKTEVTAAAAAEASPAETTAARLTLGAIVLWLMARVTYQRACRVAKASCEVLSRRWPRVRHAPDDGIWATAPEHAAQAAELTGYEVCRQEFDGPHAVPESVARETLEWLSWTEGRRTRAPPVGDREHRGARTPAP
jgi:hypothetical protein